MDLDRRDTCQWNGFGKDGKDQPLTYYEQPVAHSLIIAGLVDTQHAKLWW